MLRFRYLLFFGCLPLLGLMALPAHCATSLEKTETTKRHSAKTSSAQDKKNRRKASPPVATPGAWQAPLSTREKIGLGLFVVVAIYAVYERVTTFQNEKEEWDKMSRLNKSFKAEAEALKAEVDNDKKREQYLKAMKQEKYLFFAHWVPDAYDPKNYKDHVSAAAFIAYLLNHPKTDLTNKEQMKEARAKIKLDAPEKTLDASLKALNVQLGDSKPEDCFDRGDLETFLSELYKPYPQLFYMKQEKLHSTVFLPTEKEIYWVVEHLGICDVWKFSSQIDFLDVIAGNEEDAPKMIAPEVLAIPFPKDKEADVKEDE